MQRLSKILSRAGIAARRKAEDIITQGRVTVNGKKVLLPQEMVDPENDSICVEGEKIRTTPPLCYFALNKPKGYICSNAETLQKRAIDLIPHSKESRLFTIGRLDKDTEGLLLLTNDGHFAHRLMHPSFETEKEYLAKVDCELLPLHLEKIMKGCIIEGTLVKPKRIEKVRRGTIKLILVDGKKHEARELLKNAGCSVLALKRIRIGSIVLGTLPVGTYRELTNKEISTLTPKKEE